MAKQKANRRAVSKSKRSKSIASNPRFRRGELVRIPGIPAILVYVKRAGWTGLPFISSRLSKVTEPSGDERIVRESALSPVGLSNPVRPGWLGYVSGVGPVKVVRREGGGFFGPPASAIVTGSGVPEGIGQIEASRVMPISNPVYACPACANPIRPRRGKFRCPHCRKSLALVG